MTPAALKGRNKKHPKIVILIQWCYALSGLALDIALFFPERCPGLSCCGSFGAKRRK
jgi:hypothetical protein